jgi:ubiquinone biosynthesis protein
MAKLLTLLFEITALFDMATRIELVMLQKTMVVVEGVARKLDPRLNMWATAEPVVGGWIAENLGPRGKIEDFGRGVASLVKVIGDAPERLERLGRLIERWEGATASDRANIFDALEQIALRDGKRAAFLPITSLFIAVALLVFIAYRM